VFAVRRLAFIRSVAKFGLGMIFTAMLFNSFLDAGRKFAYRVHAGSIGHCLYRVYVIISNALPYC
jgi:hypothetical protein